MKIFFPTSLKKVTGKYLTKLTTPSFIQSVTSKPGSNQSYLFFTMNLSTKLLNDLESQIIELLGAFPAKDSAVGEDLISMQTTLRKCRLALKEGN